LCGFYIRLGHFAETGRTFYFIGKKKNSLLAKVMLLFVRVLSSLFQKKQSVAEKFFVG
jgi:hypothetical protein